MKSFDNSHILGDLRWKHFSIFVSAIVFWFGPGTLAEGLLLRNVFHDSPPLRTHELPMTPVGLSAFLVVFVAGMLAGKYAWLGVLSRFCTKSDVFPYISCGVPRRISNFDRRILEKRFHLLDDPAKVAPVRKTGLTRRETRLLIALPLIIACLFSTQIIPAINYPKHSWLDWLVVAILIQAIIALWAGGGYMIVYARRKSSHEQESKAQFGGSESEVGVR